jgi:CRP-like cAMP-binding protein
MASIGAPSTARVESAVGPATLRRNFLLARMAAADHEQWVSQFEFCQMSAGEVLQREGVTIDHVYFPIRGVVSTALVMPHGTEVVSALIGREGVSCNETELSCGLAFVRAIVCVTGAAWRLRTAACRQLLGKEPLHSAFASYRSLRLFESEQNAACNLVHDVESRLCRWILHLQDRVEGPIPMTHAAIAAIAGIRRTTVTLVLGRLQAAGITDTRRGTIDIVDRFALEAAACECYGAIRAREAALNPASSRQQAGDQR